MFVDNKKIKMSEFIQPDSQKDQRGVQQIRSKIRDRMESYDQVPTQDKNNQKKLPNKLAFVEQACQAIDETRYGQCSYRLLAEFDICSEQKHICWSVTVEFISLKAIGQTKGQSLKLYHYQEMISKFARKFNKQQFNKKVAFQIELSKMTVYLLSFNLSQIKMFDFISKQLEQIKSEIIQKILQNIQFQNQLTKQDLDNLAVNRAIIERKIDFRQISRKSIAKQSTKPTKIIMDQKYQTEIVKLMKNFFFSRIVYRVPAKFNQLILQKSHQHQKIPGLLKQYQENSDIAANQTDCSIYEMFLDKFNEEKIFSKKKQKISPNMICEGIEIKQTKQSTKPTKPITTLLSSVQFIGCIFKFNQSVHNNNFDELIQQGNQDSASSNQSRLSDYVIRNMATKSCLRGGKKSQQQKQKQKQQKQQQNKKSSSDLNTGFQNIKKLFANEYKFIKSIRNRIFPYIAQYYLKTQKVVVQDSKQTLEQIVQKTIYMDHYDLNLNQYIQSEIGPFQKLLNSKILAILIQIASTLRYLERIGILHRDFKHTNIMIDCYEKVRFIDWGTCCLEKNNQDILSFQPYKTPLFSTDIWSQKISPEILNSYFDGQCQKFQCNEAYDIYSFGVLIQFILSQMASKHTSLNKKANWIMNELVYLMMKTKEINPYDRPKPIEILLYLNELMKISRNKQKIISKIHRDQDKFISSVEP